MIELNFPNPVSSPRDYFGREAERGLVHDLLARDAARIPVLLGERKIGKTSTLNVLEGEYTGWARSIRLPHRHTVEGFLQELANGVHSILYDPFASPPGQPLVMPPDRPDRTQVLDLVRRLAAREGRPLVFVVDELDSLLEHSAPEAREGIVRLLLALRQEGGGVVRYLFTMSRVDEMIPPALRSDFREAVHLIPLRPWSREELGAFLRGVLAPHCRVEAGAQEVLFREAGGHPYFTKAILHLLLESRRGDEEEGCRVGREEVLAAVDRLPTLPEVRLTVQNLFRVHFDAGEHAVLRDVAAGRPVEGEVAARLVARGYLHPEGDGYRLRVGLLERWLAGKV